MAVKAKKNTVNPLNWQVPLVDKAGKPTDEFMRKWAQQGRANGSIPELTTAQAVSDLLDTLGLAQGDILYRDATTWKVLAPGTLGYVLQSGGAAANPSWAAASTVLDRIGATQGEILYRNGTVWTVLAAGTSGQLLSYDATAHAPVWSTVGGVLLGSGAPSSLQPAGVLYSRTDLAGLYSSQPTLTPTTAVLQFAKNIWGGITNPNATFSVAPTSGNLLIAACATYWNNGAMPAASGWTRLYDDATGFVNTVNRVAVFYKYAGAGESTTQTFSTAGSSQSGVCMIWEISNPAGSWASDFQEEWHALAQAAAPTLTSAVHTTAANNQLILGFAAGDIFWSTANQGAGPTNAANGQTDEGSQFNDTGTTSHQASIGSYKAIVTAGTNYQLATTYNHNQEAGSYQFISLNEQGTLNANWTLIGPAPAAPVGANPSATAGPAAVNGSAATFMRSDGAPAIQKASAAQFGIVEVDGTTITAVAGVISAVQPAGANPSATAGPAAVNGVATTFMRSDGAPAIQKASAAQFGIVEVDGTSIKATAGVISASAYIAAAVSLRL